MYRQPNREKLQNLYKVKHMVATGTVVRIHCSLNTMEVMRGWNTYKAPTLSICLEHITLTGIIVVALRLTPSDAVELTNALSSIGCRWISIA